MGRKSVKANMSLKGNKTLAKIIKNAPKKMKPALKQAVNAGATPLAKEVKALTRKRSGFTAKSVKKKAKAYSSGVAVALVGVNKEAETEVDGKKHIPANIWHLITEGTVHKAGSNAIVKAMANTRDAQDKAIQDKLKKVLDKIRG